MATTAQGIADYSAGFEKIIQPYIQNNIPNQTKLLKVLKTNDNVEVFNNNFYVTIRSGRHGGVQTLANDKSKLNSGGAPLAQGTISPAYLAGVFDISDVVIKASRSRKQALQSDLQFQAQALVDDFAKQANRQYFSDGVGVVAMVSESSGSVGSGTVQIQYPDGNMTTDGRATAFYGTTGGGINGDILPWFKYFAPGNIVGIGSAGTAVGTITSTGISGGTQYGTLVMTGVTPFPGSAPIYILDGDADAAGTTEIQGFRAAMNEGTNSYMGLARSTLTWQPQIQGTAQNQSLSIPSMERMFYAANEYARPGDRYVWFMNQSLISKFGDLLTALRRTVNEMELVSGWSGLAFQTGDKKIMVALDYDCPDGEAVLVNLDTWTVCEIAPMGFVQDELLRRTDYVTFQKVFSWYTNLACRAPAANGRMVRQTR
jgi:hypothetical protein